ncbi:MAG: hypothetical protein OD815_000071 [Candidatus Alkanophagales archaeon MCA70_species_2]|nr:hypothetical protein [Candidatus Alkanophaga liquidiphilum]RLG39069.1 MAG: hypothetical protein DRN91_00810 [Candidatus Alkanophagales archaeon]
MHDAILQIRTETRRKLAENERRSLRNIIERYKGRSECIPLYEDERSLDFYVTSVNDARHIASKILRVLGGRKKESTSFLRVERGKPVYRFTICITLLENPSRAKYGF